MASNVYVQAKNSINDTTINQISRFETSYIPQSSIQETSDLLQYTAKEREEEFSSELALEHLDHEIDRSNLGDSKSGQSQGIGLLR